MIGLGTILNSAAIVAGGLVGHFTGKLFRQEQQDALTKACGISVLFIAIAGAMQGMLAIIRIAEGTRSFDPAASALWTHCRGG